MSAPGVRRGKAALFQWVRIPPGHRSTIFLTGEQISQMVLLPDQSSLRHPAITHSNGMTRICPAAKAAARIAPMTHHHRVS